ncbi:ABC transporter permease, partial [Candidatus Curtissbacteria bacterium]|nr:ABC transporter permease [Candidatus Curtissbacteria bacterium]
MSLIRIWAVILRHIYLTKRDLERFADLFIWPTVGILLWGFLANYAGIRGAGLTSYLLGGIILWMVFERVGTSIGIDFMYEVWDRSIVNVLASPLTLSEFITGLVLVSVTKVLIAMGIMAAVALFFFGFSLGSLGISLVLLWINVVIFAVSLGIFNISIVIRFGGTIGPLTWVLPFVIQPFVAVFYPVSVLPATLQKIVWYLPLVHVFEGMRSTIKTGQLDVSQFWIALILNVIYFALSVGFFAFMFNLVKKKGTL